MKRVVLLRVTRILFSIRDIKLRVFAPGSPGTRFAPGVRHYRSKVKIIRVISLNLNSFETAVNGERGEEEEIKIEKDTYGPFYYFLERHTLAGLCWRLSSVIPPPGRPLPSVDNRAL